MREEVLTGAASESASSARGKVVTGLPCFMSDCHCLCDIGPEVVLLREEVTPEAITECGKKGRKKDANDTVIRPTSVGHQRVAESSACSMGGRASHRLARSCIYLRTHARNPTSSMVQHTCERGEGEAGGRAVGEGARRCALCLSATASARVVTLSGACGLQEREGFSGGMVVLKGVWQMTRSARSL